MPIVMIVLEKTFNHIGVMLQPVHTSCRAVFPDTPLQAGPKSGLPIVGSVP